MSNLNEDISRIKKMMGLLNEQSTPTQQDYRDIADALYNSMKGLSTSDDSENVESIIINRINNKNEWEGVKRAFGVRDGENLEQWIRGELRLNINDIMRMINQNDSEFKKQDSMYNVGSKIRLITNRQFIIARSYQYAEIMRNRQELALDINDATVIRRDKDGIVIKVPYVSYYEAGEKKDDEPYPKQQRLSNPCIKIPFSEIIEWRDDTLQIRWFSDFVGNRVVPC
jgi:hypothetical protein